MNKFIKKLFTVAMTLSMTMPNLLSVVHAYEPLEYGKAEQQASDGNVLLDVKGTDVTVETGGSEQTISGDEGTRQEVAKGSVIKATGVTYFVAFHKDGSYETFTGDVEYQTNENTAYVSVVGGVSQTHLRKKRSTGDVNSLAVGDTFSGTFGTSNTNPGIGSQTFYVDAVTGLLAQVSDQIIGSQYVTCQEHGYVGLTNINAWSLGRKAEYVYNATVTSVAPDGTVTLSIDVPHYLKPGTNEEATGWNAQLGTVPYQRCAGTWVIKTAPRAVQMYVRVEKSNGNPEITKNNQCYAQDLSGAVYGVFRDSTATTDKVGEIKTDANGVGALMNITVNAGENLYVKELKAPKGFALDTKIYTVSSLATAADGWYVRSTDMPMNDPVAIRLTKKSADKVENPASLEGAEFTVKYYAGQYTKETLPENATRTWVIKTLNKNGRYFTRLGDEYKVSGDDFYLTSSGIPTLPLGTITVEETKAPNGYTLENKTLSQNGAELPNGVMLFNITETEEHVGQLVGGNEYTINEGVKRSGFNIKKIDRETNEPVGIAEFKILNPNNYDVKYMHKDGTSEIIAAGKMSEETIVTDAQGNYTSASDALQAGSYKLIETKAPEGYLINEVTDFEISNDAEVNTIATEITVLESKMRTKASVEETNTNVADGSKTEQTLTDTVEYHDLIVGKEYTLVNEWVIKPAGVSEDVLRTMNTAEFERLKNENGDVIKTTTTFVPETSDGFITVKTKFNPSKYAGHKLVAFEDMFKEGLLVGHHANILDEAQTVTVSMDLDVRIAKADAEKVDHYLQGAEITVYNQDGTIAKDKDGKDAVGVTDKNGQVSFKLAYDQDNQMYVMETKAPEGYELSAEKYPITRTGKDKLGVDLIKINVLDNAIVIPPTGVETNPLLFVGIGVVALATLGVIFLAKKKN